MYQCCPKWKLTFCERGKHDHRVNLRYFQKKKGGTVQNTRKKD